jgi:alkylhydroperoxidase/carboxymuconolactone decarboxylase family protein YurZ
MRRRSSLLLATTLLVFATTLATSIAKNTRAEPSESERAAVPDPAAAHAISIEAAGKRFLDQNPAPEEIKADWNDWAQRSGSEVWARPGLTRAQRSLVTIAILSVLREEAPLRVHIEAGIANGLTRLQIAEVLMHSAVYAGVPQALQSMKIAREVFDQLDATAAGD